MPAGTEYSLGRWLKVRLFGKKNVRHESLRVAVDHREPCALHLHHDPVTFPEGVVVGRKRNLIVLYRISRKRLRFLKAFKIATTENIAGNHQMEAPHFRIGFVLLRIYID